MTPAQIKQRLEEAGRTLCLLPMPRGGLPGRCQTAWPEIVRTETEFRAAQVMADKEHIEDLLAGRNSVRIRPLQKQIEEMNKILEYIIQVPDPMERAVLLSRHLVSPYTGRAPSYRQIGNYFRKSHEYMRRKYNSGLSTLARLMNGE